MIEHRRHDAFRLNVVLIRGEFIAGDVRFLMGLMSEPRFIPDYDRLVVFLDGADANVSVSSDDIVQLAIKVTADLARRELASPVRAALAPGAALEDPLISSWPLFQQGESPVIVQTFHESVKEALVALGLPADFDPLAATLIQTNAPG